jgi:hypothetical protein
MMTTPAGAIKDEVRVLINRNQAQVWRVLPGDSFAGRSRRGESSRRVQGRHAEGKRSLHTSQEQCAPDSDPDIGFCAVDSAATRHVAIDRTSRNEQSGKGPEGGLNRANLNHGKEALVVRGTGS